MIRPQVAGRGARWTDRNPGHCAAGHGRLRCSGWRRPYRLSRERWRRACASR